MKTFMLAAVGVFGLSSAALADVQHVCTNGDVTRSVEVVKRPTSDLACEVIYRKPNEGEPEQSLWRASHDMGYCEQRSAGLVDKLSNAGWNCAETVAVDETASTDETESDPESAAINAALSEATNNDL